MRVIWIIGRQSLQYLLKDRSAVIWFLLVPLMYIFIFGNAFSGGSDPSESKAYLAVRNLDDGILSNRLLKSLRSDNISVDSLAHLPEEAPLRVLTIPDSFSYKLFRVREVDLGFEKLKSSGIEPEMTAELAIQKARFRLLALISRMISLAI